MKHWTESLKAMYPGHIVSDDQLISPTPGLIAQTTGRLTKERYKVATVYVDQFSGYGFVYLQRSHGAKETMESKTAFEAMSKQHGIQIENYHADNGVFRSLDWMKECRKCKQGLTFAGVQAHHTNGKAERRIRYLQDRARSMIIHAQKQWGVVGMVHLWPYAIRMANEAINESPNMQDVDQNSPLQIYTGSQVNINPKHWVPFGCPAYVLTEELQDSKQIYNKWKPRSKIGIYLGRSPMHGRNVALVLNSTTGLVSAQFHVDFDEGFQTLEKYNNLDHTWISLAGFTRYKDVSTTSRELDTYQQGVTTDKPSQGGGRKRKRASDPVTPVNSSGKSTPEAAQLQQQNKIRKTQNKSVSYSQQVQPSRLFEETPPSIEAGGGEQPKQGAVDSSTDGGPQGATPICDEAMSREAGVSEDPEGVEIFSHATYLEGQTTFDNYNEIYAMKSTSDPDTLYYHEAMKEPDADKFNEAMDFEWEDQMGNGNFQMMLKSEVPQGAKILPSVWQMKRKRDVSTGEIKRYKARLNLDGSRMEYGVDYQLTYAPVAKWHTIRLAMVLAILHDWRTVQIDYVLAFPQAPIEKEMYMKLPKGLKLVNDEKDYVLKVKRNVYGQKQAGRVWNKYLVDKLTNEVGFTQSEVDECLFYRGNSLYVLYTDDSIILAPTTEETEEVIADIKAAGLNITVEGDLQDFLGVNIQREGDNMIRLSQPHLERQICKELGLDENSSTKKIPAASSKILKRHAESEKFKGSFNYRSIIGKVNYLEKGSRLDLAYATHQAARFVEDPKLEHGEAVQWMGKYIHGTIGKGLLMTPRRDEGLEVFVDADFAGNWDPIDTTNRDTARSRHGYVITYHGMPILWKSQMQNEIALSTTESEYTGLSYALREAIPIINLLKEMEKKGIQVSSNKAKVRCRVFEDNTGALEIAKEKKYRPRTKHMNIRLHHFRYYVDELKEITIHKIDTKNQLADLLTKPLCEEDFVRLRLALMGW